LVEKLESGGDGAMTTHYIVQCTAEKSLPPGNGLRWVEGTSPVDWKRCWNASKTRKPVSQLYTGNTFTKSMEAISASKGRWMVWVASAGGGLLRGPSSSGRVEDNVPGYEAYCFPSSPMNPTQMRSLWEGGGDESYTLSNDNCWSKIDPREGDTLVISLPKSYQSSVLPSMDEHVSSQVDVIGIGNCLPYSDRIRPVGSHPRIREVLGCGFSMMRTTLLERWLKGGDKELRALDSAAASLPDAPQRQKIEDSELRALILEAPPTTTSSKTRTIRWVRDECRVSASENRIKSALSNSMRQIE
jgi:hypothetical protein